MGKLIFITLLIFVMFSRQKVSAADYTNMWCKNYFDDFRALENFQNNISRKCVTPSKGNHSTLTPDFCQDVLDYDTSKGQTYALNDLLAKHDELIAKFAGLKLLYAATKRYYDKLENSKFDLDKKIEFSAEDRKKVTQSINNAALLTSLYDILNNLTVNDQPFFDGCSNGDDLMKRLECGCKKEDRKSFPHEAQMTNLCNMLPKNLGRPIIGKVKNPINQEESKILKFYRKTFTNVINLLNHVHQGTGDDQKYFKDLKKIIRGKFNHKAGKKLMDKGKALLKLHKKYMEANSDNRDDRYAAYQDALREYDELTSIILQEHDYTNTAKKNLDAILPELTPLLSADQDFRNNFVDFLAKELGPKDITTDQRKWKKLKLYEKYKNLNTSSEFDKQMFTDALTTLRNYEGCKKITQIEKIKTCATGIDLAGDLKKMSKKVNLLKKRIKSFKNKGKFKRIQKAKLSLAYFMVDQCKEQFQKGGQLHFEKIQSCYAQFNGNQEIFYFINKVDKIKYGLYTELNKFHTSVDKMCNGEWYNIFQKELKLASCKKDREKRFEVKKRHKKENSRDNNNRQEVCQGRKVVKGFVFNRKLGRTGMKSECVTPTVKVTDGDAIAQGVMGAGRTYNAALGLAMDTSFFFKDYLDYQLVAANRYTDAQYCYNNPVNPYMNDEKFTLSFNYCARSPFDNFGCLEFNCPVQNWDPWNMNADIGAIGPNNWQSI